MYSLNFKFTIIKSNLRTSFKMNYIFDDAIKS